MVIGIRSHMSKSSLCKCRLQRGQGKAQSPAVQGRHRAFQSLEASLSSQLDPIDWATYEPYLWGNEATYYQRAATLFGALLQTQRLHAQVLPSSHCLPACCVLCASPRGPAMLVCRHNPCTQFFVTQACCGLCMICSCVTGALVNRATCMCGVWPHCLWPVCWQAFKRACLCICLLMCNACL